MGGGAATACSITGIPGHPVENVSLNQVMIEYQGGGAPGTAERAIPELPDEYPDADMFGELPAYGSYVSPRPGPHAAGHALDLRPT